MSNVTQVINIEGMTCSGCVKSVDNVVSQLDGVQNIAVDLDGNKATVTFDTQATSVDAVIEAIEDAGFDASIADS